MKYLKFTYVDAVTGTPVSEAPATNGPKFPDVDGLEFSFALESQYPTSVPIFFGTCPDESITMVPGVIDALTEADFLQAQKDEMHARVPKVVTIRQARLALLQSGLLDDIDAAIAASTDRALKIEWEFATEFRRDWPALIAMQPALGLTDQQVDDLFHLAVTL
jgi:hypothetical protein